MKLRKAILQDAPVVMQLVKELAEYENLSEAVTARLPDLERWLFEEEKAEVWLCELQGRDVGFISFFYNFSTFRGKPGIYLEDIFIRQEFRGSGVGKMMLSHLAKLTVEHGCDRIDWMCLNWNQSAISFYQTLGAKPVTNWMPYRLWGSSLSELAENADSNLGDV